MRITPARRPEYAHGAHAGKRIRRRRFAHDGGMQRVNTSQSGPVIADHIRRKVIYEGLELEEVGIDLADVTDDVRLFEEDGLNLDSIDALEIVAGVQREFGLSLPNVDQAFIDEHCSTVGRLASMVADRSRANSAPGGAAAGAAPRPESEPGSEPGPDGVAARTGSAAGS